jgi:hypothetical protein
MWKLKMEEAKLQMAGRMVQMNSQMTDTKLKQKQLVDEAQDQQTFKSIASQFQNDPNGLIDAFSNSQPLTARGQSMWSSAISAATKTAKYKTDLAVSTDFTKRLNRLAETDRDTFLSINQNYKGGVPTPEVWSALTASENATQKSLQDRIAAATSAGNDVHVTTYPDGAIKSFTTITKPANSKMDPDEREFRNELIRSQAVADTATRNLNKFKATKTVNTPASGGFFGYGKSPASSEQVPVFNQDKVDEAQAALDAAKTSVEEKKSQLKAYLAQKIVGARATAPGEVKTSTGRVFNVEQVSEPGGEQTDNGDSGD